MKTCHRLFRVAASLSIAAAALFADMLRPPVVVVLFAVSGVTRVPMRELVKSARPFIALVYAVLVPCMLFLSVVTTLPRAPGY